MPSDVPSFLKAVSDAGILGLLALWLIGGARGDWVWGREHRRALVQLAEERAERIKWQDLAYDGARTAERLGTVAKRRA